MSVLLQLLPSVTFICRYVNLSVSRTSIGLLEPEPIRTMYASQLCWIKLLYVYTIQDEIVHEVYYLTLNI